MSTMMDTDKLEAFEKELPPVVTPLASYVTAVQTGNLIYTSGVLPIEEGKVIYTGAVGSFVVPVSVGQEAARLACMNLLSVLKDKLGTLKRVEQIVKLTGYVNSVSYFTEHPAVINGASDLLLEVFGDRGRHARAAIGVASLPRDASVELEVIVQVSP